VDGFQHEKQDDSEEGDEVTLGEAMLMVGVSTS